jgi:Cu/Ag efflux protein CusF
LRHGEIKSLDMPPMTMVFHVLDARLLNGLAAGDSVRFRTVQDDGRYIVTAIEKR